MLRSLILPILLLPSLSLAVFDEGHLLRRGCSLSEQPCDGGCIPIGYFCCNRGTGDNCILGSYCCSSGCCLNAGFTITSFSNPALGTATTSKATFTAPTGGATATSHSGSAANGNN